MDIPALFETRGEKAFRELETAVARDALLTENCVISTGGGLPMQENMMQLLLEHSVVIFLKPSLEELYSRLQTEKGNRPLLNNIPENQLENHIRKMYYERLTFYKKAHLVIKPGCLKPAFLAQYLLANFK